jgi:hypothetical protein
MQDLPIVDEEPPSDEPQEPLDGPTTKMPPGTNAPPTEDRPPHPRPGDAPLYKGEPLDPARGPGLGCFWFQVVMLAILLVLTPLTVLWAYPSWISATLLIISLVLLLFAGQTVIFLLRLVAADRRTRRRPMGEAARKTVGMIEDEGNADRSDPSDKQG